MPTTLEQSQYGFDRNSRRTWQRRALSTTQDQQYNYDALSQVNAAARGSLNLNATAISGIPASSQSWDYDPTGNWRGYHSAANGTVTLDQNRVHDRGNRLTQIEANPHNMILDRVGRMRQMAPDAEGDWDGKLEITWDAWSRITSVKNNGEVVGEYAYDGRHRRVTREVDSETLHSYYNDAWRPVEERKNAATTAAASYLWGARHRDDLVRRDRAVGGSTLNETRYVLMDYFNPAAITDETGVVKERYAFTAFGVRTILNPDFTVRSSSECGLEFGFQGQFLDGESGLMNYGYRYYSPQLGRWTCKDPIEEKGGVNLYGISNVVSSVDVLGLLSFPDFTGAIPDVMGGKSWSYFEWFQKRNPIRDCCKERPDTKATNCFEVIIWASAAGTMIAGHAGFRLPGGTTYGFHGGAIQPDGTPGPDGYANDDHDMKGFKIASTWECCCLTDEEMKKLREKIAEITTKVSTGDTTDMHGESYPRGVMATAMRSMGAAPYPTCSGTAADFGSGMGCANVPSEAGRSPSTLHNSLRENKYCRLKG